MYLCWNRSPELTDAGLEQLTELDVNRLYVFDCGISPEITPDEDGTLDLRCDAFDEVSGA
jgi:hypothetical protein